ncbi:hypothetical protein [Rhizobium sp. PP-CC-3G-465]|uniref:hypothetical protein n=1 Tax=Rhizobium sp. PP-CC-3G-465 TaxID=2135648 RepID=UPI0010510B9F|nr:hypothetical protein C8J33_1031 [Rhizobium sp. PP-CC-3G-465]
MTASMHAGIFSCTSVAGLSDPVVGEEGEPEIVFSVGRVGYSNIVRCESDCDDATLQADGLSSRKRE